MNKPTPKCPIRIDHGCRHDPDGGGDTDADQQTEALVKNARHEDASDNGKQRRPLQLATEHSVGRLPPRGMHTETDQEQQRDHRDCEGNFEPRRANRDLAGLKHFDDEWRQRADEHERRSDHQDHEHHQEFAPQREEYRRKLEALGR